MITFKKKIGTTMIGFCILLVIFNIISFIITKTIDKEIIIINIFYLIILLWQYIKYLCLKRRGVIQKQVRYIIEKTESLKKEYKILYAYIKANNGMEYKVYYSGSVKDLENIPDKGFVDVIVDKNNFKNYFILIETVKGR